MPSRNRIRDWRRLDDESLLALRFCDLPLDIRRGTVARHVQRLHRELAARGIEFEPHVWFGVEWFSPDGVPGISVPFYLADPRLKRLERRMMHEVEGGESKWLIRILRHEAGHAIDTAYGLRRRADWRAVFGPASRRYPSVYTSRPGSRRFVLHIGDWYAQSHPTEDFAETFAVWMQPRARWRRDYAGWPALRKLEYVDTLMAEIAGRPPKRRNRRRIEPIDQIRETLGVHYRRKLARYDLTDNRHDARLVRVFATPKRRPAGASAARFLREIRPQIERLLNRRARMHPYIIEHAMTAMILRAQQLDLRLARDRRRSKRDAARLVGLVVLDVLRRNREHSAL